MSILVGLYDDLSTVQQVAKDLENRGFAKDDLHLATYDQRMQSQGSGFFDSLSSIFGRKPQDVGTNPQNLIDQMTSWGIPQDDAQHYAEAMRRGTSLLMVNAPDDMADDAKQVMDGYDPVDLDERVDQWQSQGWQGYDQNAQPYSQEEIDRERSQFASTGNVRDRDQFARTTDQGDEQHIPIVEEEMRVGKRQVQRGGVRIHRTMTERPVEETQNLRDETVRVEKRPVDRPASEADLNAAFQDQTFEVTETDEELITDKQARVTGEVVVSKQVEEHPETVRDTVRRTDVQTEDLGAGQTRTMRTFDDYNSDFRDNYNLVYANRGRNYSYYEPAYRYGYDLAGSDRYRGQKWSDVEVNARRDWERQNPNTPWDDVRDAIRHGWERVSSQGTDSGSTTGYTGGEGFSRGSQEGRYTDPNQP